jgi:hypothetical protein
MKLILALSAAAIAMPAIAQNAPAAPPPADQQTAPAAPLPPPPPPPAGPATVVMGPSMAVVQPLPDTAVAPAGDDVPWCTKTVVDHCRERSNARGERLHTTPRPPGK